ncbi:MAG: hypothetical protein HY896_05660 [Deltaproteobacteria bacterium]|nr:hypothetical protein [Deltaproteobacteria bacterium]
MKAKHVIASLVLVTGILICASGARAETLSWDAVTTYTDGSAVGSATVTYTTVWSTSSSLASPNTLATGASSTSVTFNVSTAGMPRGSTIYFGVRATVGGVNSSYSAPLSWAVPAFTPSSPVNLRIQ